MEEKLFGISIAIYFLSVVVSFGFSFITIAIIRRQR